MAKRWPTPLPPPPPPPKHGRHPVQTAPSVVARLPALAKARLGARGRCREATVARSRDTSLLASGSIGQRRRASGGGCAEAAAAPAATRRAREASRAGATPILRASHSFAEQRSRLPFADAAARAVSGCRGPSQVEAADSRFLFSLAAFAFAAGVCLSSPTPLYMRKQRGFCVFRFWLARGRVEVQEIKCRLAAAVAMGTD